MRKLFMKTVLSVLVAATLFSVQAQASWKKDSGGWWWQEENGTYPKNSWKQIGAEWYLFDASGYMKTGWAYSGGEWYYLLGSGAMAKNRWVGDYYLTNSGAMAKNTWINGYYVNGSGKWVPDRWVHGNKGWWYRKGDGSYPTGWAYIGGTWYYFDGSGWMKTGWVNDGSNWYFLNGSGAMVQNQWVGNYYLTGSGAMARNVWVGPYYIDDSGKWVKTDYSHSDKKIVRTEKNTYTEKKDVVKFAITTVYDNTQPKGSSGVSKSGQDGYTVYTYEKTTTYYSDGTSKDSVREVGREVVAPVNQVNWVGTYEAPKPSGHLNNAEAERAAQAINEARVANGGTAASYTISSDAKEIYEELWSVSGLGHWGYPGECVAYAGNGSTTVQAWLSDGHRAAILNNVPFVVSCYTDADGVNWFIYYYQH